MVTSWNKGVKNSPPESDAALKQVPREAVAHSPGGIKNLSGQGREWADLAWELMLLLSPLGLETSKGLFPPRSFSNSMALGTVMYVTAFIDSFQEANKVISPC